MARVQVFTVNFAAAELGTYRERVRVLLAGGELTAASINKKAAVVNDTAFQRVKREIANEKLRNARKAA